MSLIAGRLNELIYEARDHINHELVEEIAAILHATGQYGSEATELVTTVLAVNHVLNGPDADNARYLSRGARA